MLSAASKLATLTKSDFISGGEFLCVELLLAPGTHRRPLLRHAAHPLEQGPQKHPDSDKLCLNNVLVCVLFFCDEEGGWTFVFVI